MADSGQYLECSDGHAASEGTACTQDSSSALSLSAMSPKHGVQSPSGGVSMDVADLRLALQLVESSATEDLKAERQKRTEEMASLHRLLQESQEEATSLHTKLEEERLEWSRGRTQMASEIETLHRNQSANQLESQLMQSQAEVAKLKSRLDKAVESAGPQAVTLAALLGVSDINQSNDESVKELERMDFDQCPVSDLRMYMMALITQKRLLQEDNHKLATQIEQVHTDQLLARPARSPSLSDSRSPSRPISATLPSSAQHSTHNASTESSGHHASSSGTSPTAAAATAGQANGDLSWQSARARHALASPSQASPTRVMRLRSSSANALGDTADGVSDLIVGSVASQASASVDDLLATRDANAAYKEVEELHGLVADLRIKMTGLSAQLAESRTLCENYEVQLQQAQSQSQLSLVKQRDLEEQLDKYVTELNSERERMQRVEDTSQRITHDIQSNLAVFAQTQANLETEKSQLVDSLVLLQEDCRQQLDFIIEAKDKLSLQFAELQDEYKGHRESTQDRILQLKAELAAEKGLRHKAEDCMAEMNRDFQQKYSVTEDDRRNLATQLEETCTQLRSEQLSRHEMEQQLKLDLVRVQAERDDTKVCLATELRNLEQALSHRKDVEHQLTNLQGKSKEIILALQTQLEQEKASKISAEERCQSLRGQLENMRQQLDSSQLVQQDFVRLSQNLQVQLANMVDKQREVRWEHEDDIETCRGCEKLFSVTRRKHHCRQCGKIFCSECSSKTVPGGQSQRPMRVCDPCHTVITTDAPMQFAMDSACLKK
eukprot:scpid40088/ scgid4592/ Early endosome antigen 1